MHITHESGSDSPRHGFSLPSTLMHGVVERVFGTTISERGSVVGARFRPGGFAARFERDAAVLTGRVQPIDDELFAGPIHLDDDVESAAVRLDEGIGAHRGEPDRTFMALTALVDRIRDDDRLHRVEQVMRHSPWSAAPRSGCSAATSVSRSNGCYAGIGCSRPRWRSSATRRGLRRPRGSPRLV
jgi:hypothetical protein